MREIIFRGKSLVDEAWKYGYYTKIEDNYIRDGDFLNMVKPETVGQYTGLQDKNGVKIFEGDVLLERSEEFGDVYVKVVFGKGAFVMEQPWWYERDEHEPEMYLGDFAKDVEVVGNVFENAELLEVE